MTLAVFPLFALALGGAELRIDHVTIAGSHLADMESRLAVAGFVVEAGGPHTNKATQMAVVSFPDGSYLELIAPQERADAGALAANPWGKFIEQNAGPCAWAVRPKDFTSEAARIRQSGVAVTVVPGGRTRPDGTELKWERAVVGSEGDGTFFPFLIHDLTARERRAYPGGKPGNRDERGILRVVIGVRKLSDAVERFSKVYPAGKPLQQVDATFGAELAWFTDTPVIFAAPLGVSNWISRRIGDFGEGPVAIVLARKKPAKSGSAARSRWFGAEVEWFDPEKLGWRLGVEDPSAF